MNRARIANELGHWLSSRTRLRSIVTTIATCVGVLALMDSRLAVAMATLATWATFMWFTRWHRWDSLDRAAVRSADQRIILRPPRRSDRDAIMAISQQPANQQAHGHALTPAASSSRREWLAYSLQSFVAVEVRTNTIVAEVITGRATDPQRTMVGLRFHQEHLGRGLATEVLATALGVMTEPPWVASVDDPLCVETAIDNHRVRAMLDKLGYTAAPGTFLYSMPNGRTAVTVRYVIDRTVPEQWRPTITTW